MHHEPIRPPSSRYTIDLIEPRGTVSLNWNPLNRKRGLTYTKYSPSSSSSSMLIERLWKGSASLAVLIGTLLPFFTIARSILVLTEVVMLLNARVFNFERTIITRDRAGTVTITTSHDKLCHPEDRRKETYRRGFRMNTLQVAPWVEHSAIVSWQSNYRQAGRSSQYSWRTPGSLYLGNN